MGLIRDYIPETANPTKQEAARFANAKAAVKGGVRHDFVPAKGYKLKPPAPNGSEAALARALLDAERSVKEEFEAAKSRLAKVNIAEAVALISELPLTVQEMYLVAEASAGNRPSVLELFPEPDVTVKERYLGIE